MNALDINDIILGSQSITITVVDANDVGIVSAITGELRVGEELTVGDISDEDGSIGNERYQWLADGSAITGATTSSYTLQASDVGRVITIRVTYDDNFANNNEVTSAETAAVTSDSLNAIFTSPASATYMENSNAVVLRVVATDSDPIDTVVNYSVTGTDSSLFSIASNGDLTFDSSPNFEMPSDNGQNNVYDIVVNALDSDGDTLGIQSIMITVTNANETGSLSAITGVLREGEELTVGDVSDADEDVDNLRYQWFSDDVEIASATSSTYTLQSSDVGTAITVQVTYNDGFADDQQLTSIATALVSSSSLNASFESSNTATYMENSNAVVLTVVATDLDLLDTVVGYSVTGTDSSLFSITSDGDLTFDSSPNFEVPFGDDNVYEIVVNALDVGDNILGSQSITITVVNANDIGTLSAITGLVRVGEELTVGDISDADGSITSERYQWFSDNTAITGATNSTYTLRTFEVGAEITVQVTYNDSFGNGHQLTSAPTTVVADTTFNANFANSASEMYTENSNAVVLTVVATDPDPSDTVANYSVTGTDDSLFSINPSGELNFNTPPNFEMALDNGQDNEYSIVVNALDSNNNILGIQSITITVEDANDIGTLSSISGVTRVGELLTAGDISDADGSITSERYQWFSDDTAILGATNSTYTLTSSEVGTQISVRVTYNDSFGNDHQLTSDSTIPVTSDALNADFTSSASATYMENSNAVVLTVVATDPDSSDTVVNYSVTGTDNSLFSIASNGDLTFDSVPNFEIPEDAGGDNEYNIVVNALDSGNNILGSQIVTITVLNVNEIGTLSAISGTAQVGELLTAGDISDADGSVTNFSYQWLSDDTAISGATFNTYTLTSTEIGTVISVRVTYDDGFGTGNELTSATTIPVTSTSLNAVFSSLDSATYMENSNAVVLTVVATDPDSSDTVMSYSVTGIDSSLFIISSSGTLRFRSSPNFEIPEDAGGDNEYDIVVNALDGDDNILGIQLITVTVEDANDVGTLSAISGTARIGDLLTAGDISDADGPVSNLRYQWLSDDTEISGATNSTYILTSNEVGTVITVQVTYNDSFVADNQLTSEATSVVRSAFNAVFSNPSNVNYIEGRTSVVLEILATDPDPSDIITSYSITGIDSALFSINSSGQLRFNTFPSFDSPSDDGENNVYNIDINALDVGGNILGTQSVVVVVIEALVGSPLSFSLDEDEEPQTYGLLMGASSTDALSISELSYTVDGADPSSSAPLGFTRTGTNLRVDPSSYQNLGEGDDVTVVVSYSVTNDVVTVPQTATITITGVNDLPRLISSDDRALTIPNGLELEGDRVSLSSLFEDIDDEALTFAIATNTPNPLPAGLTLAANGNITGTVAESSDSSSLVVRFSISDGEDSITEDITLNFLGNPALLVSARLERDNTVTVAEDTSLILSVLEQDLSSTSDVSPSGNIVQLRDSLNTLFQEVTDLNAQVNAIDSLVPRANTVVSSTVDQVINDVSNLIQKRLLVSSSIGFISVRGPESEKASIKDNNIYYNVSYNTGSRDGSSNAIGYDYSSFVLGLGYEKSFDLIDLGASFSYGSTSTDNNGGSSSDINTVVLSLYGNYHFTSSFVNLSLNLGINNIETNRTTAVGSNNGSSDAFSFDLGSTYGYTYSYNRRTKLTGLFSLRYNSSSFDDIVEDGVGAVITQGESYDSFYLVFGGVASLKILENASSYSHKFSLLGNLSFNLLDVERDTQNRFNEGIDSFETQGVDEEKVTLNLGFGWSAGKGNTIYEAGYDLRINSISLTNTLSVKISHKF